MAEGFALRRFKRNLDATNSHPLAAWLSFSEEAEAAGLAWDPSRDVADVEAECDALIGARPCPDEIPHGWESSRRPGEVLAYAAPCPSCGAAL